MNTMEYSVYKFVYSSCFTKKESCIQKQVNKHNSRKGDEAIVCSTYPLRPRWMPAHKYEKYNQKLTSRNDKFQKNIHKKYVFKKRKSHVFHGNWHRKRKSVSPI